MMTNLPEHIIENGINYTLIGDYYFPDFTLPEDHGSFGKWGDLHLNYLKEHQHKVYAEMLYANKLVDYLEAINEQAEDRYLRIIVQMKQAQGITEQLKAENQMEWVRRMAAIHDAAQECVLTEIVFS